jgi:hypothetical protein
MQHHNQHQSSRILLKGKEKKEINAQENVFPIPTEGK